MVSHADTDVFDSFYRQTRLPLLVQTWALTGDLGASQRSVRDTFVAAWHHWTKVNRLTDMESWVRPRAWARAMRRRHVLNLHREAAHADAVEDSLAALAALSQVQRKVLLLGHLTDLDLVLIAREAGVEPLRAAAELASAEVIYRELRGVDDVVASLEPLAEEAAEMGWPQSSTITRAGTARRRLHTTVGAAATIAAVTVAGWVVSSEDGVQPTLASLQVTTPAESESVLDSEPAPYSLSEDALLTATRVGDQLGGRWTEGQTAPGAKVIPCQSEETIDPDARAELTRWFSGTATTDRAGQLVEVSQSPMAARTAYRRMVTWIGGCSDERVQLDAVYDVDRTADVATVMQLTDWHEPTTVRTIGLARTGTITTAVSSVRAAPGDAVDEVAGLLSAAVDQLCDLPGAGACAGAPKLERVAPPPIGAAAGLLGTVDLPPVTGVDQPWAGTKPDEARFNAAATRCDQSSFDRDDVAESLTETFVIPTATDLPAEFGITQTVGRFGSVNAAKSFVEGIRTRMGTCSDRELGAQVTEVANMSDGEKDTSVWHLQIEISDTSTVLYFMSIARDGRVVSQLGFVPAEGVRMADGAFLALNIRSLNRLTYF
ncbi:MAG: hypothetical protein ACSLEW_06575 [Nocardioides sp.]